MIDSPFQRMSPGWGWYTWLMVLKIDVLPAPLGPMMANSSPGCDVERHVVDRVTPPNRRVIVVDLEQIGARTLRSSPPSECQLMTATACGACSA